LGPFDHLFSDTGYTGSESEITDFTWRKTGLFIPFWLAKLNFYGLEYGEMKEGLFWGSGIPLKTDTKPTLLPTPLLRRRLSSREEVLTPKISLIREKTARLFWNIPGTKPVWQSGVFSQQKITANSTYWEAKRW
jgi:hypothetical protein